MKTVDTFELILKIENKVDINVFRFRSFNTWPLVRQMLWYELTRVKQHNSDKSKVVLIVRIFLKIKKVISALYNSLLMQKSHTDDTKIFFSRPVFLQKLSTGRYLDRIIDPIILSLDKNDNFSKYYVSKVSKSKQLDLPYFELDAEIYRPVVVNFTPQQELVIDEIYRLCEFDFDLCDFQDKYRNNLNLFIRWFDSANALLKSKPVLKEIYLSSWYFPDMMGICAAASKLGMKTIDVQHGKQGRHQAMYSGWTKIPKQGYNLIPDSFWCWGQPSCDHILASSPNRNTHIPFIGGYPWIDYYRKNIAHRSTKTIKNSYKIRVLVVLQPLQHDNPEIIPDFIVSYLLCNKTKDAHFTFRMHPNDNSYPYCIKRLRGVSSSLYSIDLGESVLYDAFLSSTHHITAYSSCAYEAELFNLPTLLYGNESRKIYAEDIGNNVFSWTEGNKNELEGWLSCNNYHKPERKCQYIDSRVDLTFIRSN